MTTTQQPGLTAQCKNCHCRWEWHRRALSSGPGHETAAGYCSCPAFVPKLKKGR
jgi:hypothetical protein